MKTELKEACQVIEDLLDTINWLGGDAYEMECIQPSVDSGLEFLHKVGHKTQDQIEREEEKRRREEHLGVYCLRSKPSMTIRARCKREAKNRLGVSVKKVKCLQLPRW